MQGSVKIHGKNYTEVKERLKHLYESDRKFPNSYISTEMFAHAPDMNWVVFKATLFANESESDERYWTGWAFEERLPDEKEVNFSSWVENCETSAIGRALANANIGVSEDGARPSSEEVNKVERWKSTAKPAVASNAPVKQPIRKIGAIKPDTSTKAELITDLLRLKEECVKVLGHDQPYQQMLANGKITNLFEATETSLSAMIEGFGPFLLAIEDMKKEGKDYVEASKKLSLLL